MYCNSCIWFEDEDGGYCNFYNNVTKECEETCEEYEDIKDKQ